MNITQKVNNYLNEMNRSQAVKEDKNDKGKIEVYVDDDEIVGLNSGFVYASPSDPDRWIEQQGNFVLV